MRSKASGDARLQHPCHLPSCPAAYSESPVAEHEAPLSPCDPWPLDPFFSSKYLINYRRFFLARLVLVVSAEALKASLGAKDPRLRRPPGGEFSVAAHSMHRPKASKGTPHVLHSLV